MTLLSPFTVKTALVLLIIGILFFPLAPFKSQAHAQEGTIIAPFSYALLLQNLDYARLVVSLPIPLNMRNFQQINLTFPPFFSITSLQLIKTFFNGEEMDFFSSKNAVKNQIIFTNISLISLEGDEFNLVFLFNAPILNNLTSALGSVAIEIAAQALKALLTVPISLFENLDKQETPSLWEIVLEVGLLGVEPPTKAPPFIESSPPSPSSENQVSDQTKISLPEKLKAIVVPVRIRAMLRE